MTTIQYWRTYEQLERYARHGQHLEAWQRFNRAVGTEGAVGVFHETYLVEPGRSESIYVNMPRVYLAKAGSHEPVGRGSHRSRERLGADRAPN
ncbi:monooxygenase family protein [Paenibacillus albicereus]|uniref:monooxygenase family protein n=1 Tax=Paenibacillus albicereus TaxID=2726185 RepID=UPI0038B2D4FD